MQRVRVLHCIQQVRSGGVERRRLSLARGLDPRRYEQALICTQALGELPDLFEREGCNVYQIGPFQYPLDFRCLRRALPIIKDFAPHVIHGAIFEGISTAAIAGRLARVPVIIGEETSYATNRRLGGRILFRLLSKLSNRIVAVSPEVHNFLRDNMRIPEEKLELVTNGVAEPSSARKADVDRIRSITDVGQNGVLIGAMGRIIDDLKLFSDVIKSMRVVLHTIPNARLVVVGEGSDLPRLRQLVTDLDINESVYFAGYQSDTRPWFEAMDIFAHVAAREAFGLVLVEAMFAKNPVVATRIGGMKDIVEEGVTGIFVEPNRPIQIADAIINLCQNRERRLAMGAAGLERARLKFSESRYVQDVARLYEKLLVDQRLS